MFHFILFDIFPIFYNKYVLFLIIKNNITILKYIHLPFENAIDIPSKSKW